MTWGVKKGEAVKIIVRRWFMLVWTFLAMLGLGGLVQGADLSLSDVTNAAAGAQGSFNYGGGIGLAALTVAIGVGFLMFGLSLRKRR